MKLKYIVTGTGRCGTAYSAKLLTSLGIPCGHETFFDYNGLSIAKKRLNEELPITVSLVSQAKSGMWIDLATIVAESSYCAAPFLKEFSIPIIHIVRNPFKVISSFLKDLQFFHSEIPHNEWEQFIYSYVPELNYRMSPIKRVCLYYIRWNQMIENNSEIYFRHRVEDDITPLINFLGCSADGNVFADTQENTMKQREKDIDVSELPQSFITREFLKMANRYGY